jgi:predicted protein tyrosine phosphatase
VFLVRKKSTDETLRPSITLSRASTRCGLKQDVAGIDDAAESPRARRAILWAIGPFLWKTMFKPGKKVAQAGVNQAV